MNTKIQNTLGGRKAGPAPHAIFNPRTLLVMIVLGVFSFGAYFVLSGFAGNFKTGNNGSEHALSKSAVGYAGLMHLLKENGHEVGVSRKPELTRDDRQSLRIISLSQHLHTDELKKLVLNTPTLIILPKWNVRADPAHKGWVRKRNTPFSETVSKTRITTQLKIFVKKIELERSRLESEKVTIFARKSPSAEEQTYFYSFPKLQTLRGDDLISMIVSDRGTLLSKVINKKIYILSDPGFLNTQGVANPDIAEFALEMMNMLKMETDSSGFTFDLYAHGFAPSRNFIKLALSPPFLAATLCLFAMGFLIAWQAFARFGSPVLATREIALGKLSLIYNASDFIKRAGREYKMGAQYTKLTKKLAREHMHLPRTLSDSELTQRLDLYSQHASTDISWSELEHQLGAATNASELMSNARKLFKWRTDITQAGQNGDQNGHK